MRAIRPRFWGIASIVAGLGVCGIAIMAQMPAQEFDPVEDTWYHWIQSGDAAAESLRYAAAERHFRLAELVGSIDRSRPSMRIKALDGIATALWAQGRYAEAMTFWRREVELREVAYGATSEDLITTLNTVAGRYREMGRDSLAEAYEGRAASIAQAMQPTCIRAIALQEAGLPASSRTLADRLVDLGDLYMAQDRADLAELPYSRAVELRECTEERYREGPVQARLRLARASASIGKFSRAASIYRQTLSSQEKAFGQGSQLLASLIERLAFVEFQRSNYDSASALLERSLRIRQSNWGRHNPVLVETLTLLAQSLSAQTRYEDALRNQVQALAISRRAYSSTHLNVAQCLLDLASIQIDASRYSDAREASGEALAIFTKVLGSTHATTVECREVFNRAGEQGGKQGDAVVQDTDDPAA